MAQRNDFDIALHRFVASDRTSSGIASRTVRFAVSQNSIILPTGAPVNEQYQALKERHEKFVRAASLSGVNILCFQELWHLPFAFATREKLPWTDFSQSVVNGDSTQWLKGLAKAHNMVIVSPILERDDSHAGILWNTAVVIDNHGEIWERIARTTFHESVTLTNQLITWKEMMAGLYLRQTLARFP